MLKPLDSGCPVAHVGTLDDLFERLNETTVEQVGRCFDWKRLQAQKRVDVEAVKGASEGARKAAGALAKALADCGIVAMSKLDDDPNPTNKIHLSIGIKP